MVKLCHYFLHLLFSTLLCLHSLHHLISISISWFNLLMLPPCFRYFTSRLPGCQLSPCFMNLVNIGKKMYLSSLILSPTSCYSSYFTPIIFFSHCVLISVVSCASLAFMHPSCYPPPVTELCSVSSGFAP